MAPATLALPCAAYEVDPLECTHCGATMRIIAIIDRADVVERILNHLNVWDPPPETSTCFPCTAPKRRDRISFRINFGRANIETGLAAFREFLSGQHVSLLANH